MSARVRMIAIAATGAALLAAGCGAAGTGTAPRPAAPAAGPGPTIVGVAPPPSPAVPGPAPEPVGARVAAATTRWLYARDRAAVTVAPATAAYRAGLRSTRVPAELRGGRATVAALRVVRQSAAIAIVSWTVIDDRSRLALVATLGLRDGRWRAQEAQGE